MKKIVHVLLFILCSTGNHAYSQVHETVQLEDDSKLITAKNNGKCLVFVTGKEYILNGKLDWKIDYYNDGMKLKYQVKLPDPSEKNTGDLLISPSGNNVYYLPDDGKEDLRTFAYEPMLYVDSNGTAHPFNLSDKVLDYYSLNAIFADDAYLYFVTKDKVTASDDKEEFPDLHFIRINEKGKTSSVQLELPRPEPKATEWSYIGHSNLVSYFASRSSQDSRTQKYRIAVLSHNGKLVDHFVLDINIKQGIMLASHNHASDPGSLMVYDHSYGKTVVRFSNGGESVIYTPYAEAFGNIMFDPISNGFYVFGLSGEISKKAANPGLLLPVQPVSTGFYAFKFDQDGKNVWACEGKLDGIDDYFKKKAVFMARNTKLSYGFAGNLMFQAFSKGNAFSCEIDPTSGKLIDSYANTFKKDVSEFDLGACHNPVSTKPIDVFLSKGRKSSYSQLNFRLDNSNIIIKNYFLDSRLEMYLFDN